MKMRILAAICNTALLLFAIQGFTGCTSARVASEKGTDQPSGRVDERGFDPLELPQDSEILPLKYPESGIVTGKQSLIGIEPSESRLDDSRLMIEDSPEAVDSLANQAYRVQIFTSKLFGEARQAARIAEEIFDRPVFVDYEVPYFKVRVGSFSSRGRADTYRQKVRAVGYTNAWVVMVNVNVKQVNGLYDEPLELPLIPDTVLQENERL